MADDFSNSGALIPWKIRVGNSPVFVRHEEIGNGGFGSVHRAERLHSKGIDASKTLVSAAIKFERKTCWEEKNPSEWRFYNMLKNTPGVPNVYFKGTLGQHFIMIMDLLGKSLHDAWFRGQNPMTKSPDRHQILLGYAISTVEILQRIHEKGIVHGDVKSENFVFGRSGTPQRKQLFLIDFGLSSKWKEGNDGHVKYHEKPNEFVGTYKYASVHAHLGRKASRRDDLESLAYSLIHTSRGFLPWNGEKDNMKICNRKMESSIDSVCGYGPSPFKLFFDYAINLKFDEDPDYQKILGFFRSCLKSSGMKRDRQVAFIDLNEDYPHRHKKMKVSSGEVTAFTPPGSNIVGIDSVPRNSLNRGMGAKFKWIIVVSKSSVPKRQNYVLNVRQDDLDLVISFAHEQQGMYLTNVVSGYSKQCWNLFFQNSEPARGTDIHHHQSWMFPSGWLPIDKINEVCKQKFNISVIAWDQDGTCFVVTRKGLKYQNQCLQVKESLPSLYEWIEGMWSKGYAVTNLACMPSGQKWCAVMAQNTGFTKQAVEMDLVYPSESIHRRWDEGFFITCCAANKEMCALVLSKSRRVSAAQQSFRSDEFPQTKVDKEEKHQSYISCLSYGRTVS